MKRSNYSNSDVDNAQRSESKHTEYDEHVSTSAKKIVTIVDERTRSDQEHRLELLEMQLEELKRDMRDSQKNAIAAEKEELSHLHRNNFVNDSNNNNKIKELVPENNTSLSHEVVNVTHSSNLKTKCNYQQEKEVEVNTKNAEWKQNEREVEEVTKSDTADMTSFPLPELELAQELCTLVPHLSPYFHCSSQDALLLISAIRNGGDCFGHSTNSYNLHNDVSLMEKYTIAETDKRLLAEKLERQRSECESAKSEIAVLKERLETMKTEHRQRQLMLSQRNEESRRQLLIEQTRSEKMNVRNRKLELEINQLKERLHYYMH